MGRPAARGRTNDPEGLRARLLDTAFAAFTTRGYHYTSVQDLKQEAEVSSGALAHHFPTKREIGMAVLQDRVAEAVEQTWMEPIRKAATASGGIQQVFADITEALDKKGSISGCPLNNLALELSTADTEFRYQIDEIFTRWREVIAEKIRADQMAGKLRRLDADKFATFVVASYSGAMAMAKAGQSVDPLRACAEQLAQMMQG